MKIPVSINLSYWLFLLLVMGSVGGLCMEGFLWAIVLTFSILIHEYGHALTALYFGATPMIVLQAFGGITSFNEASITDKQKFLVTLAGPLFQALLALIAYMLLHFHVVHLDLCNYLLFLMFHINTRCLLLNLLPIAPFDGGLLVRYILEKKFGHKGYLASIIIGLIAAAIAIPYCYLQQYHWFFIMQLFLSGWQYCKLWQKKTDV